MTEWMPWCHADYSMEESADFIARMEQKSEYAFAVLDSASGRYLGGTGLNQINSMHGYANLGYWIRRSEWGKGYAVAAIQAVARFGFEELGLIRAEIVIAVGNHKSQRAAEKAGALHEGILRNRLRLGTQQYDAHMYSLIPEKHW